MIEATAGAGATYNVPIFSGWHETVDVGALTTALSAVVARHEALRTTFELRDGQVVQLINDPRPPAVVVVEAADRPEAAQWVRADALRRAREPFDLAEGPLLRCVVWHGLPGGDAVLLTVHHIVIDGWSLGPLFDDLATAYDAALAGRTPDLPELPVQYADFAVWDQELAAEPELEKQLRKRAAELVNVPSELVVEGSLRVPPAPEGSRPGRQQSFRLTGEATERIADLARKVRATPFVVLFAAAEAVLHRRSGQREFLLGAVTANRRHPDVEALVGFFANTVPLRCAVDSRWSFAELCAQARAEVFSSLTHQRLPYDRLTSAVSAARGTGRAAMVNVGFVHQTSASATPRRWGHPVELPTGTAKFDLLLILDERPDGMTLTIEYDTGRCPDDTCRELGEDMVTLLTAVTEDASRPLRDLLGEPRVGPEARPVGPSAVTASSAVYPPAPPAPPAPLSPRQREAAQLFQAALRRGGRQTPRQLGDGLTPEADFFGLGGHSLLAVTMLAEAKRHYGAEVSPREFLADPTVAGLARLLKAGSTETMAPSGGSVDRYRATSTQQRMWLLSKISSLHPAYLLPIVIELTGEIDDEALRRAVDAVLARHPALRSRFELDRRSRQIYYRTDGSPAASTVTDASGDEAGQLREHLMDVCTTPFDLSGDPPVRAEIIRVSSNRVLLALVAHHIVLDGWSQAIVLDQITRTYRAEAGARPGVLVGLPTPVHPGVIAEPDADGQVAAAVVRLAGAPTDIRLPHDRPRPEVQSTLAGCCSARVGAECYARLRVLAMDGLGCTAFVIAAVLLAVALRRRCGQRDFLFAFPWSGRESAVAVDAVGMFVSTLVLRATVADDATWRDLLINVRDSARASYRDAAVPYDALVAELHPERDLSRPPLTPVYLTSAEEAPVPPPLGESITARYLPIEPVHIKYELEFTATVLGDDLELSLSYALALFETGTAASLLDEIAAGAAELAANPDSRPCGQTRGDRSE